jgi:HlyD family secretion protein
MPTPTSPAPDSSSEPKPPPPIRRWLRTGLKLLVVALVAIVLAYKLKFSPAPVVSHLVALGPVVAEVMGTGTLEARVKTTISPRIQERLAEMLVDQGDPVRAGQLLARLDDGELKRQVEVSEAALASAKATADRVHLDEARAQAVERQAQQDHKRISLLVAAKISSQSEMDKAIEQLHVSESDLLRARAATVEAQQQVTLAEKNLAYQQERLTFTRILSPYDGVVVTTRPRSRRGGRSGQFHPATHLHERTLGFSLGGRNGIEWPCNWPEGAGGVPL